MIGLVLNRKGDIRRLQGYLKGCGINLNDVTFVNKDNYDQLKVIIKVGGKGCYSDHCYVKQQFSVPEIQIFDPSEKGARGRLKIHAEPFRHYWIVKGIQKAKQIAKEGKVPTEAVDILVRPTMKQIESFLEEAMQTTSSFDIESDPGTDCITTFGIAYRCVEDGLLKAISIPLVEMINLKPVNSWMPHDEAKIWKLVAQYMGSEAPKVMQNFIFDTLMMSRAGVETKGAIHDTMVLQHLVDPEFKRFKALNLADLGRNWLWVEPWKDTKDFRSTESLWYYNARDAAYTLQIFEQQYEELTDGQRKFYRQCLEPLALEVLHMCERGWAIDYDFLDKVTAAYETKVMALRETMRSLAGDLIPPKVKFVYRKGKPKAETVYFRGVGRHTKEKYKVNSKGESVLDSIAYGSYVEIPAESLAEVKKLSEHAEPVFERNITEIEFNPGSSAQILQACKGLGITLPKKDGKESADKLALLKAYDKLLAQGVNDERVEFLEALMEFRATHKILTTYCNFTPDEDGKARFNITIPGTVTSRFSSKKTFWKTGFNSQNIPKKIIVDGEKRSFRSISIPHHDDYVILNMDFKQADPHMVAWLSGCQKMLDILKDPNGDLHSYTASMIYGRDITLDPDFDKDTSQTRKLGKIANNGLNYGMKPKTFMSHARKSGMKLTLDEATAAYEGYHAAWPEVKGIWYENVERTLRNSHKLTTPFGRIRNFYGNMADDWEFYKMMCEALAYVPPTQVSDCVNMGNMLFLPRARKEGIRVDWLQQCHDSNKWQVHEDDLEAACKMIQECYNEIIFFIDGQECNFGIDLEYGRNWGELTPWLG